MQTVCICLLSLEGTREGTEGRAGLFGGGEKNHTHPIHMHNPEPVIHDVGAPNVLIITY